jgi:hypothetical protein
MAHCALSARAALLRSIEVQPLRQRRHHDGKPQGRVQCHQFAENRHHQPPVQQRFGRRHANQPRHTFVARRQLRSRGFEFSLDALGVPGKLQRQIAGRVAAAVAFEQTPAAALLDALQRAEYRRRVGAKPLGASASVGARVIPSSSARSSADSDAVDGIAGSFIAAPHSLFGPLRTSLA